MEVVGVEVNQKVEENNRKDSRMSIEQILQFFGVIIALTVVLSAVSWKFHNKIDETNSRIVAEGVVRSDSIKTVFDRFDGYKKHVENDLLKDKVDEKFCNLQHKKTDETLARIESKLDALINQRG